MTKVISHSSSLVVLPVCVQIDDVAVQGPDKGDVQRRVVRRGTLHQGILTSFNVGTGRCQADLCRLWGQKSDDKPSYDTAEDLYGWLGYNCSVSTDGHKRAETSCASEHEINY